jgi:hypothetical protein
LYAQLCQRLDRSVENFEPHNSPITTFRKLLLTVCQHEFDNRANYYKINNAKYDIKENYNQKSISSSPSISTANANNNELKYGDSEEEKLAVDTIKQAAKKKMLGNVKFIGELGQLDLLSEAILHKCIKTLLEKHKDEKYADMADDLECLCKIMTTVGKKLDRGEAIKLMDQYFERIKKLKTIGTSNSAGNKDKDSLPQRIRFMLQDCIDLRNNNWVVRQHQLEQAPKTMNELRNTNNNNYDENSASNNSRMSPHDYVNNYLLTKSSPSSNLLLNMFNQFSQQPNMTLLNAVNEIASNLNQNSKKPNLVTKSDSLESSSSSSSSIITSAAKSFTKMNSNEYEKEDQLKTRRLTNSNVLNGLIVTGESDSLKRESFSTPSPPLPQLSQGSVTILTHTKKVDDANMKGSAFSTNSNNAITSQVVQSLKTTDGPNHTHTNSPSVDHSLNGSTVNSISAFKSSSLKSNQKPSSTQSHASNVQKFVSNNEIQANKTAVSDSCRSISSSSFSSVSSSLSVSPPLNTTTNATQNAALGPTATALIQQKKTLQESSVYPQIRPSNVEVNSNYKKDALYSHQVSSTATSARENTGVNKQLLQKFNSIDHNNLPAYTKKLQSNKIDQIIENPSKNTSFTLLKSNSYSSSVNNNNNSNNNIEKRLIENDKYDKHSSSKPFNDGGINNKNNKQHSFNSNGSFENHSSNYSHHGTNHYLANTSNYPTNTNSSMASSTYNRKGNFLRGNNRAHFANLNNALGVSNNEILPLNKPIIPIEKVIKHDTKHGKGKTISNNQHPCASGSASNTSVPANIQTVHPFASVNNSNGMHSEFSTGPNILGFNNLSLNSTNGRGGNSSLGSNSNTVTAAVSANTAINTATNVNNSSATFKNPISEIGKKIAVIMNEYMFFFERVDEEPENSINTSQETNFQNTLKSLKNLKLANNEQLADAIYLIIVHSLSKSDSDRANISKLFVWLQSNYNELINTTDSQTTNSTTLNQHSNVNHNSNLFMNGFKLILNNLSNLEAECHFVKSHISLYAARAICDQIISLTDLAQLMKHGAYYPLFFLCMQRIHKLTSPDWLRNQLEKSKINLLEMLPCKFYNFY